MAAFVFYSYIINFIVDKDQSPFVGYLYTILLFIVCLLQSFIFEQYYHRYMMVGSRIQTVLTSMIFKKVCESTVLFKLYKF